MSNSAGVSDVNILGAAVIGQTLTGTGAGDKLTGGAGDDILRGLGGADTLDGGGGNDRFFWTAGDGSDRVEGGAGVDAQFMTGSQFTLSASGGRALAIDGVETVNLHGVEEISLKVLSGAMSVNVGDLSSTDVRETLVQMDTLHAAADFVGVTGAATADTIDVQVFSASGVRILDSANGVVQTTGISGLDGLDTLAVNGGLGDDTIRVVTPKGPASGAAVSVHGDDGADTLTGSFGAEHLFGDAGNDVIDGGGGADTIDGGADVDTLRITGGEAVDTVALSGGGSHLRETIGGVTSDVVNVETLNIRPLGQSDTVSIGDLTLTSVRTVNLDLSGARGGQDGAADTVVLPGLVGAPFHSTVSLTSALDGSSLQAIYAVDGAPLETVNVTAIGAADFVTLAGGNGDDVFSTTAFASHLRLQLNGGLGDNFLLFGGTAGNDAIDVVTSPSNIYMTMNGSAPLDLVNISGVAVTAGAGADTVQVGDLGGSGVPFRVGVDLSGPGGAPDGQADTVILNFSLPNGGYLDGSQFGDLLTQGLTVVDAGSHNGSDVRVEGIDAHDRIAVNLLGGGPFELREAFNQTDFHLGSGDNTLNWWVTKIGHDSVDGGAGSDALNIGFAPWIRSIDNGGWSINLSAAGKTSVLGLHHADDPRTPGVVDLTVDLTSVERLSLFGGGGSDIILIGDQSGTSVKHVDIDVGGAGPDQSRDFVFLDGTSGADRIFVSQTSGDVTVEGLAASATVHNLDSTDHVFIRSGAGDDVIDLTNHNPGRGVVHLDSGLGNDTMIGGFGAESFEFHGGAGGRDLVVGFRGHRLGGEADVVSVFGSPDHSFVDLVAHHHLFQSGADVVLTDGAGAFMTLTSVNLASLTSSDFLF